MTEKEVVIYVNETTINSDVLHLIKVMFQVFTKSKQKNKHVSKPENERK